MDHEDLMTEDERLILARLDMTEGELSAVGEVDLCRAAWPMETAEAMSKPDGEHSREMVTMRRKVRKIVESLRIGHRSAILDTQRGYFFAADKGEVLRFCQSRHRRAMTSLVIESIVKQALPLEDGIQLFMEFLQEHERINRRIAARQGKVHTPINPADVVAAVAEKAKELSEAKT
jgi:hypothetical protein